MEQALGAVAFDERILSYKASSVSVWAVAGRQTIPFVCGAQQRALLANRARSSIDTINTSRQR